jgi:hypothetical protein
LRRVEDLRRAFGEGPLTEPKAGAAPRQQGLLLMPQTSLWISNRSMRANALAARSVKFPMGGLPFGIGFP